MKACAEPGRRSCPAPRPWVLAFFAFLLVLAIAPSGPRLGGQDLLGAPAEMLGHDRALVLNEQDQWAVVVWPLKLLVRPRDDVTELYDLAADPLERRDLAAARPDEVRALRARYGEFPAVPMDRTQRGRRWREAQAQPPPRPRSP